MTFAMAVAGPSRLPYPSRSGPLRVVQDTIRRANSTSSPAAEVEDRDSRAAQQREKTLWASNEGYARWKASEGRKYQTAEKAARAQWLGGSVVSRLAV